MRLFVLNRFCLLNCSTGISSLHFRTKILLQTITHSNLLILISIFRNNCIKIKDGRLRDQLYTCACKPRLHFWQPNNRWHADYWAVSRAKPLGLLVAEFEVAIIILNFNKHLSHPRRWSKLPLEILTRSFPDFCKVYIRAKYS
jgi:hypothetical protein